MICSTNSTRVRPTVVVTLVLAVLAMMAAIPAGNRTVAAQQASDCESGIGGRIFSNGGQLEVEILPASAGFTSELHFVSPGPERFIATNRDAGTLVKLGSFPAGTELVFSIFVRDTQRTFLAGPGSRNPDGLPHAEVTCFGDGTAQLGFEDQLGGGDTNYADLICAVRQPLNTCTYSVSPASQSFDTGSGKGTVSVGTANGCSWTATPDVNWITINSGGAGSSSGTINYSVAINTNPDARTGNIAVEGHMFTVFQDGTSTLPVITSTVRVGKHIYVYGTSFDLGAVILVNGEKGKTLHDEDNPRTVLIGKKLAKWIQPGDKLQVRSSSGALSLQYTYTP